MLKEKIITFTTQLHRDDIASILDSFSEGIKEGTLTVQKNDETLELPVSSSLAMNIKVTQVDNVAGFEIAGSWQIENSGNELSSEPMGGLVKSAHFGVSKQNITLVQTTENFFEETVNAAKSITKIASKKVLQVFAEATKHTRKTVKKARSATTEFVEEIRAEAEAISAQKKKDILKKYFQQTSKSREKRSTKGGVEIVEKEERKVLEKQRVKEKKEGDKKSSSGKANSSKTQSKKRTLSKKLTPNK